MTDQPPVRVQFARRFVARAPGQPDIHGVQFPDSGHVIADVPYQGLTAFLAAEYVMEGIEGAVIHWADEAAKEQSAAHDDGPSIAEATADDRKWPFEQAGE